MKSFSAQIAQNLLDVSWIKNERSYRKGTLLPENDLTRAFFSDYAFDNSLSVNSKRIKAMGPGDRFKTADEAAKSFGELYNDNSITEKREYGATIYKVTEKGKTYYSYSIPNAASGASVEASKAPPGTTPIADIHSHGNSWGIDVSYSDNNFSGQDKALNVKNKLDGYLTTPNGSLKKFDYKTGEITVISTDMPSDPRDPTRKNGQSAIMYPKNEPKVDLKEQKLQQTLVPFINNKPQVSF
jgi:hypothetical protein